MILPHIGEDNVDHIAGNDLHLTVRVLRDDLLLRLINRIAGLILVDAALRREDAGRNLRRRAGDREVLRVLGPIFSTSFGHFLFAFGPQVALDALGHLLATLSALLFVLEEALGHLSAQLNAQVLKVRHGRTFLAHAHHFVPKERLEIQFRHALFRRLHVICARHERTRRLGLFGIGRRTPDAHEHGTSDGCQSRKCHTPFLEFVPNGRDRNNESQSSSRRAPSSNTRRRPGGGYP